MAGRMAEPVAGWALYWNAVWVIRKVSRCGLAAGIKIVRQRVVFS